MRPVASVEVAVDRGVYAAEDSAEDAVGVELLVQDLSHAMEHAGDKFALHGHVGLEF